MVKIYSKKKKKKKNKRKELKQKKNGKQGLCPIFFNHENVRATKKFSMQLETIVIPHLTLLGLIRNNSGITIHGIVPMVGGRPVWRMLKALNMEC